MTRTLLLGLALLGICSHALTSSAQTLPTELPPVLVPRQQPTEADANRTATEALLIEGRMLQQREKLSAAQRRFQRAHRLAPESEAILQAIVEVAFSQKRMEEGSRYALLLVDRQEDASDDFLSLMGAYAVESGDLARGARLYERAVLGLAERKANSQLMATRLRLLDLYTKLDDAPRAAEQATAIQALIDQKLPEVDTIMSANGGQSGMTIRRAIGEAFLSSGDYEAAEEQFRAAIGDAEPEQLDLQLARIDLAADRLAAAEERVQRVIAAKRDIAAGELPYRLLQQIWTKQGSSAAEVRQRLLQELTPQSEANPDDAALAYFLANLQLEEEHWDQAIALIQPHLEKSPRRTVYPMLTLAYWKTHNWDALLNTLSTVAERNRNLSSLQPELEQIAADDVAVDALVAAAEKRRESDAGVTLPTALAIAQIRHLRDQSEEALKWLDVASQIDPVSAAPSQIDFALAWMVAKKYDLGEKALRTASAAKMPKPGRAATYDYLAALLAMEDRYDEALAASRKAIALDSSSAALASRVPWILFYADRKEEADRSYRRLLAQFDNNREDAPTRQVLRQARLMLSSLAKDDEQREEWLEQILDEFPEDVGAMNDLAYLWADGGRNLGRATLMLEQAVDAEPENAAYRDSLGWAYFRQGRYDQAIGQLQQAVAKINEPDPVLLEHLGDALSAAGREGEAVDAWKEAVTLLTEEADADKRASLEAKINATPAVKK
ncbi:tetratricopeptide repeat protein [Blastopirellula sp. JC732]|uniref:Tetratricopeptide repeat protein n=1 Tax=Blastopirellula sediminis TaxID=2894196 RepID=A0A9X1MSI6_9BACT|nr:tetratricopeptide repeat protein [Blastopirellula sediminis]MCC9605005.1 tetratricopeptide repeat protein [Blastopirellula sediminis]MCC9631695.1 tetratricopeptide repeat protein [Blastopirellula sediminis]